jgi:hypothetical protein
VVALFKVAVGHSEAVQAEMAIKEILDQIHIKIGDHVPQAGIFFCPLDWDYAYMLTSIRAAFPEIALIGCTTDGEISSVNGFDEDSVILMVFASDEVEIRAGVGKGSSLLGMEVGKEAALSAVSNLAQFGGKERFAVVLTDPLNAGVSDMGKGIEMVLGENFPMIGAASSAYSKKKTTYQFYGNEVLTDSIVLLLFAGNIAFSCGIQGGHSPMGGREEVTSVDKNVLYRIGDQPALDYFRRYIGDAHGLFMNYCLAVFEKDRDGFYVRSAPFCDEEKGTVTLNGVVPQGALVQIGTADKNTCVQSCENSIRMALENYPSTKPAAALLFSCAGRKMMMGTQVVKEAEMAQKYLTDIPFCGFYAYGEIGPLKKGQKSLFHGTTFVTLLLGPSN